jgi:hypothetical protein
VNNSDLLVSSLGLSANHHNEDSSANSLEKMDLEAMVTLEHMLVNLENS